MKKISFFLLLSLFGFHSITHSAGIVLGGLARAAGSGAVRIASAGLRTGGARVADEVRKDPKAVAAAGAGAWIGGHAAGGSTFYGALGGGITGYCLAKRHADLKTIQAQLQTQAATVSAFETQMVVDCAVLRSQIGHVGNVAQKATELAVKAGQHVKNLNKNVRLKARNFKQSLRVLEEQQRVTARRTALMSRAQAARVKVVSNNSSVVQPTTTVLTKLQDLKTAAQVRLAAFKVTVQQQKELVAATLNLAKL